MHYEQDKAVEIFVNWLKSRKKEFELAKYSLQTGGAICFLSPKGIDLKIVAHDNLIKMLTLDRASWKNSSGLFIEFPLLCEFLEDSELNSLEIKHVVFYLIEKNIVSGVTNSGTKCFDPNKIVDYDFKYFTKDEVIDYITSETYQKLFSESLENLSETEKNKREEFLDFCEKSSIDLTNLQALYRKIKTHYFEKIDSYNENDVDIIVKSLAELGVNKQICMNIKLILLNKDLSILSYCDNMIKVFNSGIDIVKPENIGKNLGYYGCLMDLFRYINWLEDSMLAIEKHIIFNDFAALDNFLFKMPTDKIDVLSVLFKTIERNIAAGILSDNVKILEKAEPTIKNHELFQLIGRAQYYISRCLSNDNFKGTNQANTVCELISNFSIKEQLDERLFVEAHKVIKQHYFDKENIDLDDLNKIKDALKNLGASNKLIGLVSFLLKKQIEKSNKVNQKVNLKVEKTTIKPQIQTNISRREYNKIYHELMTYFDFDNMKIIRPLSFNEIIYSLRLLRKINFDSKLVELFLMKTEKELFKSGVNPVLQYLNLKDKMLYYSGNEEMEMILEDIEIEFKKLFICSNEEYEKAKNNIADDIKMALDLMPKNYEYELSLAMKQPQ